MVFQKGKEQNDLAMDAYDRQLIAEAEKLPYCHIHPERAHSNEAKWILEDLHRRDYYREKHRMDAEWD